MTPALQLLRLVWTDQHTTSWEALNHCMWRAVMLAIGAKMTWAKEDFSYIHKSFRPAYWLGEHGWEHPYALAVWIDNTSFIKAYEAFSGRKPFIANDLSACNQGEGFIHATLQSRKRGRVALGTEVMLDKVVYKCTAITNERIVLTLRTRDDKAPRRIIKVTPEECAQRWPAPHKPSKKASE